MEAGAAERAARGQRQERVTDRPLMGAAEYTHVVLGPIFLKYVEDAIDERRAVLRDELAADGITSDAAEELLESRDEHLHPRPPARRGPLHGRPVTAPRGHQRPDGVTDRTADSTSPTNECP